ncbi:MAG: hypothetical protein Q9162_007539 [Coniocarpon cinnabarinum]
MLATPHPPPYQPPHRIPSSSNPSTATAASSHPAHSSSQPPISVQDAVTPQQRTSPTQRASDPDLEPTRNVGQESSQQDAYSSDHAATPPTDSPRLPTSPTSAHTRSAPPSPKRIKVKDLRHIQSFVEDEQSIPSLAATGQIPAEQARELPQYEISDMPVTDVIEMVAGLLTKITTTNDDQAERLHKDVPSPEYVSKIDPLYNGVLAFHGKNIPTISIMSYLTRIHKYCPATYEVFLSLLVYFDRITEKVNATSWGLVHDSGTAGVHAPSTRDDPSADLGEDRTEAFASDRREAERPVSSEHAAPQTSSEEAGHSDYPSPPSSDIDPNNFMHHFVVDSFNIHRLIIAGVTCASKFFSDVFYTNSRYAKVGGLPLPELNNLEVQFLLLNDFRLSIPVEQLEDYATMLVEFYVREVIAQRHDTPPQGGTDIVAH